MSTWILVFLAAGFFIFSIIFTGVVRRYSIYHAVLDIPNERSSHDQPTPRGGGISITLSLFVVCLFLILTGLLDRHYGMAFSGGILMVGIIGWLDDHFNLAILWRAAVYLLAALWAMYWLNGLPVISIGQFQIQVYSWGYLIAVIVITWMINLYNFMDGTDALAATQAITAGLIGGILFYLNELPALAVICFVVVTSCCGFLYWNLPPARIFMGDTGSCVLGFTFAVLAIIGEQTGTVPFSIWIILLSVFIFDTGFTLIMRIVRGERWYQAHRSHAYQRLVQMGRSHAEVAMFLLILNIFILWPMAWLVYTFKNITFVILSLLTIIMLGIWCWIQLSHLRLLHQDENQ